MFATKPRKVSLTLFCYLALVLAIATVAQADSAHAAGPGHVVLNRMIKKRAPGLGDLIPGTNGAAGDPPSFNDPAPSAASAASSTAASSAAASQSSAATSAASSASSASASQTSASSSAASSSAASSSASSSSASSSAQSSSTAASSTATSASAPDPQPTDTPDTQPQPTDTSDDNTDNEDTDPTHSQTRVTHTVTSSQADATDTGSAQAVSGASDSSSKAGLTVLIVIASCVGAVAVGWTIIRKWKFKPSSRFDDRMAPIDWQPATGGPQDDGIPGLRRNVSTASHGSFHSSGHSDESYGHSGFGAGYGAQHGQTALQPLPEHDFTAGPAQLAPVGGYADLARGPSPGPQMAELQRGPSSGAGYGATYNGRY